MSQLFTWGGQSIGVSASTSVLPMNTQDWSPLRWTGWISLQSKGLSRVFSNTIVQKYQFLSTQLSSQSNSHIHTWPLEKSLYKKSEILLLVFSSRKKNHDRTEHFIYESTFVHTYTHIHYFLLSHLELDSFLMSLSNVFWCQCLCWIYIYMLNMHICLYQASHIL